MRVVTSLCGLVTRFLGHRQGNFGMMMAMVAPVLLLASGYAINIGQITLTKSNLLAALDSAVTSTARDLTTGAISEEEAPKVVEAFLSANGLRAYAEEGRLTLDSLEIDRIAGTVRAQASVELDVAFALFGAANRQKITADSAALYSDKQIEVVMMLDVTGSMRGRKLDDLKAAAGNAVNLLLQSNKNGNSRVRVGLVPYAEAVNVGTLSRDTVFVERKNGPDLPPPLDSPYWVSVPSRPDNCATERKLQDGSPDYSDDSPYSARTHTDATKDYRALVNRDDRLGSCPSARVVPLTADAQRLQNSIRSFSADGWTAGGIAAQWGYYMLSPQWRRAVSDAGLGEGPADHDPKEVSKVAILMTDGEFNTAFAGVSSNQKPQSGQPVRSRTNAERICAQMKADGIEIFTIGFALPASESSNARAVLRACASPDTSSIQRFFDTSTGQELDAAFRKIAANIERLALTK